MIIETIECSKCNDWKDYTPRDVVVINDEIWCRACASCRHDRKYLTDLMDKQGVHDEVLQFNLK